MEENWRGSRSSSGVTINNLGRTSYILLAVFGGLGLGTGLYALVDGWRTEREARMLEYYVMELDGKLMKLGIIQPEESWSAQKRKREEKSK